MFQKESNSVDYQGLNTEITLTERYWDPWRFTWKTRTIGLERLIQIADFDAGNQSSRENASDTVIHEIGHNWDSAGERSDRGVSGSSWDDFHAISNWRTKPTANHFRSGDGQWYYSKPSRDGFSEVVYPRIETPA